jgi:hypothetical protein
MSIWDPKDFEEAIDRLPTRENPLYDTDKSIEHLAHYRDAIEEMAMTPKCFELEERIFELTRDELGILEQYSFRRDLSKEVLLVWKSTKGNKIFHEGFISDSNLEYSDGIGYHKHDPDGYSVWRISLAKPNVFEISDSSINPDIPWVVFVERSWDVFKNTEISFFTPDEIYLCLLTGEEYMELTTGLS